jgi:hypothetical protein
MRGGRASGCRFRGSAPTCARGAACRLGAIDGTLVLDSPAGRGTRLRAGVPLPA